MNKKDILYEYESKQVELEELNKMLWYVYEDYYSSEKIDLYTKANNYDRLRVFLYNIQNQLNNIQDEMLDFVNKAFEELKEEPVEDTEIAPGVGIKNGIIVENGVKHIRMGWDHQYIKGVILSDGSIIQNMQCDLNAKIPTDEELKAINDKNFKPKEEKENV